MYGPSVITDMCYRESICCSFFIWIPATAIPSTVVEEKKGGEKYFLRGCIEIHQMLLKIAFPSLALLQFLFRFLLERRKPQIFSLLCEYERAHEKYQKNSIL